MRSEIITSLVLLVIACILLVSDRILRIPVAEGFLQQIPADAPRCGVDIPSCPPGTMCMNGFCAPTTQVVLPTNTGLPVVPSTPEIPLPGVKGFTEFE
jgi:hypothetical protein